MATVKEIFNYTEQEWHDHQADIVEHVVEGRKYLGLTKEWVASNAGYSIIQYNKLENGSRFLELEDFMRIGVVFYEHQESQSPAYIQVWNRCVLFLKILGFQLHFYLERIRELMKL